MSKFFPQQSSDVVGIREELNCFLCRELDVAIEIDARDVVLLLGRLQLESIRHFDRLIEAGCEVWDLTGIVETSSRWNDSFIKPNYISDWFQDAVPVIAELCEELKEFRIPITLVYGDFIMSNTGQAKRDGRNDVVIFDWESSYIVHPFLDYHRIHGHVPEDVREEYLTLWTEYENIGKLQSAYEVTRDLGWVLTAYVVLGWALQTMERGLAQDPSNLSSVQLCE